jgi:tRNA threonylcarbamoyl adenosine modification protein YeaZ
MLVLAIDTALAACSAAVLDTGTGVLRARESLPMQRGHAESLMPMLARLMEEAGLSFRELDRVAVTTGPGSFTGLRVGIAAARGIALAAARPAVGVSTLAAFAAPHFSAAAADGGPVVAAIDARHGHLYLKVFGAGGEKCAVPRIATIEEAVRAAAGPAPRLVGSAAGLLRAAWPREQSPPVLVDERDAPAIDWVARLGAAAPANGAPPKPLYLRPPDARPQHAARLERR